MILMVVGLPIWMIFSWVYDVTPEGLKKTEQFSTDESVTATTNKRLNIIIVVMLLIAIGVNFIDKSGSKATNIVLSATLLMNQIMENALSDNHTHRLSDTH